MIRTLIKPDNEFNSIQLPEKFIGKQVEIIAFTVEEAISVDDQILTHFASECTLASEWLSPEEDKAWQNL